MVELVMNYGSIQILTRRYPMVESGLMSTQLLGSQDSPPRWTRFLTSASFLESRDIHFKNLGILEFDFVLERVCAFY